ncbi:MAG: hypothetical protein M1826_000190 [Phylliscum demangeonii]|nr:MAG: hypothetical protein M1826_000190 [Phylliscum demangeonii]
MTTDRLSGMPSERGHVARLEREIEALQVRMQEYEARLRSLGVDPNAAMWTGGPSSPDQASMWATNGPTSPTETAILAFAQQMPAEPMPNEPDANLLRTLPTFRTGCFGDNYLGVASANANLSGINGTALSVLGMEIDVADFPSEDVDEPAAPLVPNLYNKSYGSFLLSAFGVNARIEELKMPPKELGLTYVSWYFRAINPWLPILHQPTFMVLVNRFYDDASFEPSAAENVMVHMVFAIMYFQYAARNAEGAGHEELNTISNRSYHYALSFYHRLVASHTLQDVQALALICSHMRNFPKPAASWMVTSSTFTLALELGLHRSVSRWGNAGPPKNVLEVEMRKRVFYALLSILVTLSGKLGRPMPIRLTDMDVEYPEPVDDELLSEDGIDRARPGKCAYLIGIEVYKAAVLFLELFSSLYAVKRPEQNHIALVTSLELKLTRWREQWPAEFQQASFDAGQREAGLYVIYLHVWVLEFRLLLRHPSLSQTTSAEFNNEGLEICVSSAHMMLGKVKVLLRYKSLDTTWYNCAVYMLAITTTLYAAWFRRDETTAEEMVQLRNEMDEWTEFMRQMSAPLGAGNRLCEAIQYVTENTMAFIQAARDEHEHEHRHGHDGHEPEPDLPPGSRSPGAPSSNGHGGGGPGAGGPSNHYYSPSTTFTGFADAPGPDPASNLNGSASAADFLAPPDPSSSAAYPGGPGQYTYPEPSVSGGMAYPADASGFAHSAYPAPDGSLPPITTTAGTTGTSPPPPPPAAGGRAGRGSTASSSAAAAASAAAAYNLYTTAQAGQHASTAGNHGTQQHHHHHHPSPPRPTTTTTTAVAAAAVAAAAAGSSTWSPGSRSWRQWTGSLATKNMTVPPQESYSASALLQLGARGGVDQQQHQQHHGAPVADMGIGGRPSATDPDPDTAMAEPATTTTGTGTETETDTMGAGSSNLPVEQQQQQPPQQASAPQPLQLQQQPLQQQPWPLMIFDAAHGNNINSGGSSSVGAGGGLPS